LSRTNPPLAIFAKVILNIFDRVILMNNYKQQVVEFFDRRNAYDREGDRHPREANLLLESVNLQQGQKVLDIATGTGLVAIPAAQRVGIEGYVVGVDFSSGMLHQARQKIDAAQLPNIELIEADAESLDFSDRSFDAIFCCSAITYLPDIPATLQKWYRFLKHEGIVAFTFPAETSYLAPIQIKVCKELFNIDLPHINKPLGTPQKCHDLLARSGFTDIAIDPGRSGNYLNLSQIPLDMTQCFYPRGNPLAQLSQEQKLLLQEAYRAELAKQSTEQGVWYDTTTFFVRARKSENV
jgi:ubiquinone/menaquinone biosynthesis C-methylase UbiE